MAEETQKKQDSTTVRIYTKSKERLQEVVRQKAAKEKRNVTEAELTSEAVDTLCRKEEKKLGI